MSYFNKLVNDLFCRCTPFGGGEDDTPTEPVSRCLWQGIYNRNSTFTGIEVDGVFTPAASSLLFSDAGYPQLLSDTYATATGGSIINVLVGSRMRFETSEEHTSFRLQYGLSNSFFFDMDDLCPRPCVFTLPIVDFANDIWNGVEINGVTSMQDVAYSNQLAETIIRNRFWGVSGYALQGWDAHIENEETLYIQHDGTVDIFMFVNGERLQLTKNCDIDMPDNF